MTASSPIESMVSIVAPAWNEHDGIDRFVAAALAAADDLAAAPEGATSQVEVIIVDDGSTDDTAAVVSRLAEEDPRVVLVRHDRNRGLGAGVRSGIAAARGSLVLYTDSDLPVDLAELRPTIALLRSGPFDLVSAYRTGPEGDGKRRWVYRQIYDRLIRLTFGVPISDVNFAFKLFDRDAVAALGLTSEGSFIDAEIVARAHRSGLRITQVGVRYRTRSWGRSSLSTIPVIFGILRELRANRRSIREQRP